MIQQSKILVIDDDPNLRKTLADILRVKGYTSVVAGSGSEAIAAAERENISVALIDLMLPDMSGLDVMARIKSLSPLTEAIILTGHASMDSAIEATRRGAFSYLLKPYQMDDLLRNIQHGIDRQQAQAEIRRLGEALRQTQQAIVITDAYLNFEYVNPAFTRLLGYSLEEVAGKSIDLLATDGGPGALQTSTIASEGGRFNGEVLQRAKDGRIVPILLNATPVVDEQGRVLNYVGSLTDLSDLKRMEESLRESEEKFRSISASAQDAIIMLDENGAVSFWNAAAETIFGYRSDEILGKYMHQLCAPERFHKYYLAGLSRLVTTGKGSPVGTTVELVAIRKGGEEFPVEVSLSSIRHKDHWLAIGIARDISERKQAEQKVKNYVEELTRANAELHDLNAKLAQAQNQLVQSEKMASIGMLAAGVAHEINNPIGFIKSNTQTLGRYVDELLQVVNAYEQVQAQLPQHAALFAELNRIKEQIEFEYKKRDILALLSESNQGLERVTKIVHNLKDFSHMESQEKWAVDDIHKGMESTLNVIWNELKYTCEVKREYGVLPPVECVLSQLNQVFMNLLVNASQAIETKGTITIRTGAAEDQVWIEISDTGKGIPVENLKSIFDPFFTTKPVGKGTGLGLSVSYNIIQKHHGRIEVESEMGKGSTFRVWLPISQPHPIPPLPPGAIAGHDA
jgi:PAS domain S-box-containing protein